MVESRQLEKREEDFKVSKSFLQTDPKLCVKVSTFNIINLAVAQSMEKDIDKDTPADKLRYNTQNPCRKVYYSCGVVKCDIHVSMQDSIIIGLPYFSSPRCYNHNIKYYYYCYYRPL